MFVKFSHISLGVTSAPHASAIRSSAREFLFKVCWLASRTVLGSCNFWEHQALGSDKHNSHSGFANLLRGQVWTSYSVSLGPNFLIYKLEMI